jgi:hypothetical protein
LAKKVERMREREREREKGRERQGEISTLTVELRETAPTAM